MTQVSQPRGLGIGDHALNPFFFRGKGEFGRTAVRKLWRLAHWKALVLQARSKSKVGTDPSGTQPNHLRNGGSWSPGKESYCRNHAFVNEA